MTKIKPSVLILLLTVSLIACNGLEDLDSIAFEASTTTNTNTNTNTNTTGTSSAGCEDNEILCEGTCVESNTLDACGSCDPCPTLPGARAETCDAGTCVYTCEPNFSDLDGDLNTPNSNGCEPDCIPSDNEPEKCDGLDNNCDGVTDEGCDDDGDGFCDVNLEYENDSACPNGPGDCDDDSPNAANVYPNAPEICDGLDNNCNAATDEDPLNALKTFSTDDLPEYTHRTFTKISLFPTTPPENPSASLVWLNDPLPNDQVPGDSYFPSSPTQGVVWNADAEASFTPISFTTLSSGSQPLRIRQPNIVSILPKERGDETEQPTVDFVGSAGGAEDAQSYILGLWSGSRGELATQLSTRAESNLGTTVTEAPFNPFATRLSPTSTLVTSSRFITIDPPASRDTFQSSLRIQQRSYTDEGFAFANNDLEIFKTAQGDSANDTMQIIFARFSQAHEVTDQPEGMAVWWEFKTGVNPEERTSNVAWRAVGDGAVSGERIVWSNAEGVPINLATNASPRRPYPHITPNVTSGDSGHIVTFFESQTSLRIIWLRQDGTIRGAASIAGLQPIPYKTLSTAPAYTVDVDGGPDDFLPRGAHAIFAEAEPVEDRESTDPSDLPPAKLRVLYIPPNPPESSQLTGTFILTGLEDLPVSPFTSVDIDSNPYNTIISFADAEKNVNVLLLDSETQPICFPNTDN